MGCFPSTLTDTQPMFELKNLGQLLTETKKELLLFSLSLSCQHFLGSLKSKQCSGSSWQIKCEGAGRSLCSTACNYTQQKLLSIAFFDRGQWSESGSWVKCEEAKIAFIAALALPMQIFIRKASDSIVTVLLALQWLSVHPCYQEIGWNYILFMLG